MEDPRSPKVAVRKKPIPGAKWRIEFWLTYEHGEATAARSLTFTDSFVAKNPNETGRLIAEAIYEAVLGG
jgi:hypothetical protein